MDPKRRRMGDVDVSELRDRSRKDYLKKRTDQQLLALQRQVQDETEEEQRLGDRLSRAEREEFKRNRELLRIALEREQIDEHRDGFFFADSNYDDKTEALTRRHKDKDIFKSEVQLWEEEQSKKVASQISRPQVVNAEDYEFVFDPSTQIAFQADSIPDPQKQALQAQLDQAERQAKTIEETQNALPVAKYRDELLTALSDETRQFLVLVGETGSGKTTQIPRYLHEAGYTKTGAIAITQPRRVAAMSVARRVSEEMGVKLGREVGYSVRFDDKSDDDTKLRFMTDGILLREAMSDPMLSRYSVICIDEAHERSVATDLLMALVKDIARFRPELKVLILSATINASHFANYFDGAGIFNIPGRTFKVHARFLESPEANYLAAAITTVFQIHLAAPEREDILVFLTGEDEIETARENIESTMKKLKGRAKELIVCPLYSALDAKLQEAAFRPTPPGARKVVLSTNIAETSITIDGIKHVLDCGYSKENSFDPSTGISSLVITPISRASANQRAGRAGRTSEGFCYRIFTRNSFYTELPESTEPELLRTNLDSVVLTLKGLGIDNILEFDWIDPPSSTSLIKSLENLYMLGALSSTGTLTKLGRRMAELPLDLKLSKALLASEAYSCREEVLTIISVLGESASLFLRPKDKKLAADAAHARFAPAKGDSGGDFIMYLNIYNQFVENEYSLQWCAENFVAYRCLVRARDVREQLTKLCDKVEVPESFASEPLQICKALTSAFFGNCARLNRDGISYQAVGSTKMTAFIHPSSCMIEDRQKWLIYNELVLTSKEYMRCVMPIQPEWLVEVAPHMHTEKSIEKLGDNKKMGKERVRARV